MQTTIGRLLADKEERVEAIPEHTSVAAAVDLMNDRAIGSLLVTDAADKLVGIITERDVLTRVVGRGLDPDTTSVGAVMTRRLITVSPDTSVASAMVLVTEYRCRHLPVIENHLVLGVISSGDLTRWLVRDQAAEIEQLVGYIRSS